MGREFRLAKETSVLAEWRDDGGVNFYACGIPPALLPALDAWLQTGPPEKRYRVTQTFDRAPTYVGFDNGVSADFTRLAARDIEEVWE